MTEVNKERTIESIHKDYTQICAKAGHAQYQIETLKKELDILNGQLRDLNIEAAALDSKAKEAAKAAEGELNVQVGA